MKYVECEGVEYPEFQAKGNAARYIMPIAMEYCEGVGVDVGFGKLGWKMPGAIAADLADDFNDLHADNLPNNLQYVFSSHCLEHLPNWVASLRYWHNRLVSGGCIFLYLPQVIFWHFKVRLA